MPVSELHQIGEAAVAAQAEALLGSGIQGIDALRGGRNNRLYKVTRASGSACVLKSYLSAPGDPRDRLKTEFGALDFLWRCGERAIPKPLVCDPGQQVAAYSFVEGVPAAQGEAEIDAVAAFAGRLRTYSALPAAKRIGPASGACFSYANAITQLRGRLARHAAVALDHEQGARYPRFVEDKLLPGAERVMTNRAAQLGPIALARAILPSARVLSPSDFGFHNALRTPNGALVFLDFEYFGWDDPAKLAGDFLLHPGMALDQALTQRLLRGLLPTGMRGRGRMAVRLRRLYPLLALNWCAIVLNEFLPEPQKRRAFAGADCGPSRLDQQLEKAEAMLAHALEAEKKFPHGR